jgi:hypothetical protein
MCGLAKPSAKKYLLGSPPGSNLSAVVVGPFEASVASALVPVQEQVATAASSRPPAANSPTKAGCTFDYLCALSRVSPETLGSAGRGAGGGLGSVNRGPDAGFVRGSFILFQRSVTSSSRTLSKPRRRATIR